MARPSSSASRDDVPLQTLPSRRSRTHSDDSDHSDQSDSGSEDELLLDPNLPVDYSQRHQAVPRHSLSTLDHADDAGKPSLDSDRAPLVPGGAEDDDDGEEQVVEDSPYPEVRAAVHPYDDHTLPCNTLRAWSIGLSLIFLGASMNTLFSLRSPNISLGALIAQVIAWYVFFLTVTLAVADTRADQATGARLGTLCP